ncbi:MAG: TRAP transporter small permease subunit [Acidobacteriota bacterium]
MPFLLRCARGIDALSERIGRLTGWLTFLMVLIGAYNAVVRYLGRYMRWSLSSNLYIELQWYLFALVFLLAAGWTLKQDRHVRVDVLFGRLSPRRKAWVDLAGLTFFLIPFCIFGLWASIPAVRNSWAVWEMSPDPGGLPRYPIKTVVPVAFGLVLLQGVSEWIKRLAVVLGVEIDPPADEAVGPATEVA